MESRDSMEGKKRVFVRSLRCNYQSWFDVILDKVRSDRAITSTPHPMVEVIKDISFVVLSFGISVVSRNFSRSIIQGIEKVSLAARWYSGIAANEAIDAFGVDVPCLGRSNNNKVMLFGVPIFICNVYLICKRLRPSSPFSFPFAFVSFPKSSPVTKPWLA